MTMTEKEDKKKEKEAPEPEEEPTEDEQRDEEKLADEEFISSVIRAPRQGAYEQFVCQLLAQSVICTDPLKRVKVVTEAAWTIREPERKDLAIDYERVRVLNTNANALLNASTRHYVDSNWEVVSVPWGFNPTEENFKLFIAPWQTSRITYFPVLLKNHVVLKMDPYKWPQVVRINMDPFWEWFFEATDCLAVEGFNTLRNSFIAWASPQAQLYLAELTNAVDPNTYRDVLGLYSKPGRRDYAQKVKETAQPKAETQPNENSVD